MHISWLGQTTVKIQTKYGDEEVTILFDAYKPTAGLFPRNFSPQIALFSAGEEQAVSMSEDTRIINTLGEFEVKGALIYGVPGHDAQIIYSVRAEDLFIVHLGRMHTKISSSDMEKISSPDILFIPVGGGDNYLSPADAGELIAALEPRVVIPIAYACDTDPDALAVTNFIKEIGLSPEITDKKIILKKKDLPQEETKLMVLEKV